MSIETPESNEEMATPAEVQETVMWIHVYLSQVNPMGGNDTEFSNANAYLAELQPGKQITRNRLSEIKRALGMPDEKSSDYR